MSLLRSGTQSAMKAATGVPRSIAYHGHTIFLFMKADLKTAFLPVTCFAATSAPLASASHLPPTIFWILLHLLQFQVSNQTVDPEEDARNKPYRPIPSKRLTLQNALILRWFLPVACCCWSAYYSEAALCASLANCIVTYAYNELGLASRGSHWAVRNALNALGYASLEMGACLIAGKNVNSLDNVAWLSVICCVAIIATTVHAQDFPDVVGDALIGRKTLPIAHPKIARPTLLVVLIAWSAFLSSFWRLSAAISSGYIALGAAVGARFLLIRSTHADRKSYVFYNVWLLISFLLPAYYRFVVS